MSVTTPEPAAGPERKGKGKKILGLPPWAAVLGIAVTAGGIAYFMYKRHQAAAAAASSGGQAGGSTGQICYDADGNTVPCTDASAVTDQAGEISTLQTEIADLQGQLAGGATPGGGGDSGGGSSGGGTGGGGQPGSIYADAKAALQREGIQNPSQAQIREERRDILQTARQGDVGRRRKPKPKRRRRPLPRTRPIDRGVRR